MLFWRGAGRAKEIWGWVYGFDTLAVSLRGSKGSQLHGAPLSQTQASLHERHCRMPRMFADSAAAAHQGCNWATWRQQRARHRGKLSMNKHSSTLHYVALLFTQVHTTHNVARLRVQSVKTTAQRAHQLPELHVAPLHNARHEAKACFHGAEALAVRTR
jgi:hypothetical protein